MKTGWPIAFCLLAVGFSYARSTAHTPLHFELSQIGMVVNGQQICEDKGRLQDNPSKVMDQIIAAGPKAVPVLIRMIANTELAGTKEPIICYWPPMAVGDIAFCLLADLFTDESYSKTTMPGAGWEMLGPQGNVPAWEQLKEFIKEHGREKIQADWRRLWKEYQSQMSWDPKDRCFRLKAGK